MRQSENDWNGKKRERRVRMGECERNIGIKMRDGLQRRRKNIKRRVRT